MSFTYDQLKAAIQSYTENDETSFVANLPTFIKIAEERILKSVQLSLFRKNSTAITTQNYKYLPVPSDYLAPFSLSIDKANGDKEFLELKDPSFVQTYTPNPTTYGTPKYFAVFDLNYLILGPTPDAAYTAELHYFYRPVSITESAAGSDTTWLSKNAELTLLYGSLVEAYIFMKGEQDMMAYYDKRFTESLTGLKLLGEAKEPTDEYRTGKVIRAKQ